jgi:hypothetical protein
MIRFNVPTYAPDQMFTDVNGLRIPIKKAIVSAAAGTTNNVVIAAVTGRSLRVLSMLLYTSGAQSAATFKNGSGGSNVFDFYVRAQASVPSFDLFPPTELGWFETTVGVGLYLDAGAPAGVYGTCRYIEFTPLSD